MFNFFKKKKTDAAPKDAKGAKATSPKDAKAASPKEAKAKARAAKKPVSDDKTTEAAPKETKPAAPPPTSLKEALAAMEEAIPGAVVEKPQPKVSAGANLDKAKEALAKKAAGGPVDRETLIRQALAIQQTQAKMLDKLPEATRNKLRDMAMKAFVVDEPKSKDQKKKMN